MEGKLRNEKLGIECEDSIWDFIHTKIVVQKKFQSVGHPLWKAYIEENECKWTEDEMEEFYEKYMVKTLYKSQIEVEKVLELYKALQLTVSKHEEMILEVKVNVPLRIDKHRHLHSYQIPKTLGNKISKTPTFKKPLNNSRILKIRAKSVEESVVSRGTDENVKLAHFSKGWNLSAEVSQKIWKFVAEKCNENTDYDSPAVWNDFSKKNGLLIWSGTVLARKFKEMKGNLYKEEMGLGMKLKLLKQLRIPLKASERRWITEKYSIFLDVDDDNVLCEWKIIDARTSGPKIELVEETQIVESDVERIRKIVPHVNERENKELGVGNVKQVRKSRPTEEPALKKRRTAQIEGSAEEGGLSDEVASKIWEFVAESCFEETDYESHALWNEFTEKYDFHIASTVLVGMFKEMKELLFKEEMELEMKMKLLKQLRIPLKAFERRWIMDNYSIFLDIDDDNILSEWRRIEAARTPSPRKVKSMNDVHAVGAIEQWSPRRKRIGNLEEVEIEDGDVAVSNRDAGEPATVRSASDVGTSRRVIPHAHSGDSGNDDDFDVKDVKQIRRGFSDAEKKQMWNYVWKNIYDAETGEFEKECKPKGNTFWNDYVLKTKTQKSISNITSHFRKQMMNNVIDAPLERYQILKMFKFLGVSIDQQLAKKIERKFDVKVKVVAGILSDWTYNKKEDEEHDKNLLQQQN